MSVPHEPKPYTLMFDDNESAFAALVEFEFKHDYPRTPQLEGWMVLRVDEPNRIVQARLCAPFINYKSPPFDACVRDGVYQEPSHPACWLDKRKTPSEWRTIFSDSLVVEIQHDLSNDYLQRVVDAAPAYFEDLRTLRAKPTPWSQQDFLDAEACLAGVAQYQPSQQIGCHAKIHLERAARAGREPEDFATAQHKIRSLQNLAYKAAEAFQDRYHRSRRKNSAATKTFAEEDEAWMQRLRRECPGFSDWVYRDAIHHWGSWAAR